MTVPLDSPAADAARRHSDLTRALLRGYALGEPAETDAVRLLGATILGFVTLEAGGSYQHHPRPAEASWSAAIGRAGCGAAELAGGGGCGGSGGGDGGSGGGSGVDIGRAGVGAGVRRSLRSFRGCPGRHVWVVGCGWSVGS